MRKCERGTEDRSSFRVALTVARSPTCRSGAPPNPRRRTGSDRAACVASSTPAARRAAVYAVQRCSTAPSAWARPMQASCPRANCAAPALKPRTTSASESPTRSSRPRGDGGAGAAVTGAGDGGGAAVVGAGCRAGGGRDGVAARGRGGRARALVTASFSRAGSVASRAAKSLTPSGTVSDGKAGWNHQYAPAAPARRTTTASLTRSRRQGQRRRRRRFLGAGATGGGYASGSTCSSHCVTSSCDAYWSDVYSSAGHPEASAPVSYAVGSTPGASARGSSCAWSCSCSCSRSGSGSASGSNSGSGSGTWAARDERGVLVPEDDACAGGCPGVGVGVAKSSAVGRNWSSVVRSSRRTGRGGDGGGRGAGGGGGGGGGSGSGWGWGSGSGSASGSGWEEGAACGTIGF